MSQPSTSALLDCIELQTGPTPTHSVIWLHGLGADANDFVPVAPELELAGSPAIRFVFPNAPVRPVTVNNGMAMRAWYDILTFDLIRREDDAGIRLSQAAIEALIARENTRGVPSSNIVLAGFSQGCAMTLHTGIRTKEKLAGLIGLSGYLPLADTAALERAPANADTPIFMAHGTHDPVVSLERAQSSCDLLKQHGYDVTWKLYPMAHSVCAEEIQDIAAFLKRVLV